MPATRTWGRKESWIWPRHGFYYTYGAIFLRIVGLHSAAVHSPKFQRKSQAEELPVSRFQPSRRFAT